MTALAWLVLGLDAAVVGEGGELAAGWGRACVVRPAGIVVAVARIDDVIPRRPVAAQADGLAAPDSGDVNNRPSRHGID